MDEQLVDPNLYYYNQAPQDSSGDEKRVPFLHQNPDLILALLDSDEVLEQIENELKGYCWSKKDQKFIKKYDRMVTDDCISCIMPYIRTHFNKLFPLTNYDKDEIHDRMREVVFTLLPILVCSYDKFFPKDGKLDMWTQVRRVADVIEHSVDAIYHRSLGDGERRMLMTTVRETHNDSRVQPTSDNKKNIFSGIGLFGG